MSTGRSNAEKFVKDSRANNLLTSTPNRLSLPDSHESVSNSVIESDVQTGQGINMSQPKRNIPIVIASMTLHDLEKAKSTHQDSPLLQTINFSQEKYHIDLSTHYGTETTAWKPIHFESDPGYSNVTIKQILKKFEEIISCESSSPIFSIKNWPASKGAGATAVPKSAVFIIDGISVLDQDFRNKLLTLNLDQAAVFLYVPFSSPDLKLTQIIKDKLNHASLKEMLNRYDALDPSTEISTGDLKQLERWLRRLIPTFLDTPEAQHSSDLTPNPSSNKRFEEIFPDEEQSQINKFFSGINK